MKWLLVLFALLASTASAAAIDGTWKGTAEAPTGPIERTFVFKTDGGKLTGETESQMSGKSTISNGKISGDDISFSITANFQGNEMTLNYTGKIMGNEIKLIVDVPGFDKIEYTLKKI